MKYFLAAVNILATIVLATPISHFHKRILTCAATCRFTNATVILTQANTQPFVGDCFNGTTPTTMNNLAIFLYLDSTRGSCTDDIYGEVQDVLEEFLVPSVTIACRANCTVNAKITSPTIASAKACMSTFSPPLVEMTDLEYYTLYSKAYTLAGQCTFQQYNEREQAIQKYIISPDMVDGIEAPPAL